MPLQTTVIASGSSVLSSFL